MNENNVKTMGKLSANNTIIDGTSFQTESLTSLIYYPFPRRQTDHSLTTSFRVSGQFGDGDSW